MQTLLRVLFLGSGDEDLRRRYIFDALLGGISAILVTLLIYALKLYPSIPNISFLYLLVVLALASTRGLYAAAIASIVAFFSFDYFLVPPFYTLSISSSPEWLALFIFLVTSILTGQQAAVARQRAEEAAMREREARALYELVNATTNEESLERQLQSVAQAIVANFAGAGVRDCAIMLPDVHGKLALQADARQQIGLMNLSSDELQTAQSVLLDGKIIDLYDQTDKNMVYRIRRVVQTSTEPRNENFVRFVPLQQGQRVVGVARLVMARRARNFPQERRIQGGNNSASTHLSHQAAFFWTFLDQGTAMIERARLHREALQIELLRQTDELRSALLSSVSHDLRTPLSSIKAAASSLLQEDVEWDEESKKSFALAIEREADRLNRLVGNLLDMSRIEGGALKAEKEWYPIDELIYDVLGHMQTTLQGRDIRLDIADDLPPVQLDYLQIDQVVTNLLENATRYTPVGSPIEIAVHTVDHSIMVSIADHGPGIPPYDLERIFDKFYRVSGGKRKTSGRTSTMGTGLGLAVCRGLIEAHGGRIWAENRPEGGAVFHFTLPIAQKEGQADE